MKFSIIIPTYNGAKKLPNILSALEKQTMKDFEVIIVIDGGTDNTLEVLENRKWGLDLHIIHQQNKGRSATRNNGVRSSKNDLLLFFDDDMRPLPDCVEQHYRHHIKYPGTIVTGGIKEEAIKESSELFKYKSFLSDKWLTPLRGHADIQLSREQLFVTTANFSISRATFELVGGFDERLTDAEDYEFAVHAFKMAVPLYFNKDAFAWHDDNITAASYINRQRQYANAQRKLIEIHPKWIEEGFLNQPYRPSGFKASLFRFFCNRFWIKLLDNNSLTWLPQSIRYKLYDYIITANGVFFPEQVKLSAI